MLEQEIIKEQHTIDKSLYATAPERQCPVLGKINISINK
jgi:hypothetical protein